MQLLVITTYPVAAQQKVMEVYMEGLKNPLPEYVKSIGPYATWGGRGIESYVIFDIEDDKAADGVWEILIRMMSYYSIERLELRSTLLVSIEEFMARMGIEAPSA